MGSSESPANSTSHRVIKNKTTGAGIRSAFAEQHDWQERHMHVIHAATLIAPI